MEGDMNSTVSYSEVRQSLKVSFDKVCRNHEPLLVTCKNGENVVVISEDDFRSLQETAYLCQSPKNLERLLQALNRTTEKSLQEVKKDLSSSDLFRGSYGLF
jgi:antitoxin YefM